MAIKAKRFRINTGKKIYEPGEVVEGLSSKEEKLLVDDGFGEYPSKAEPPSLQDGGETDPPNDPEPSGENKSEGDSGPNTGFPMSVKELEEYIETVEDPAEIQRLLEVENAQSNPRATAVKALEKRLAELQGE